MEEIYELTKDKRIFVRKKIVNFLEKILRYCGYDFNHDTFKSIVYSEDEYKTPVEEKIKNLYDAYIFLLSNDKNRISTSLISRFYFLYFGENIENNSSIILSTKYFHIQHLAPIEQAIEYHLYVYNELKSVKEEDGLIISLMIFNYILAKNEMPVVQFYINDLEKYVIARDEYLKGKKESLIEYVLAILKKNPYMDKSYYKNLKEIKLSDIIEFVEKNQEILRTKYFIKGLWIHGSIAKKIERIDSDIDLFIEISLDLLREEKIKIIKELKELFFNEFKRMVDISEIVEYLDDDIIKEARTTKRLI